MQISFIFYGQIPDFDTMIYSASVYYKHLHRKKDRGKKY